QRLGMSNAHLAPLSDRVVHEAGMLSLDLAIGRSYRTGLEQRVLFAQHLAQHLDVPAAIDEADVLAVFLVPDRKAESTRSLAHFSLRELTEWKQRVADHLRGDSPEHVALILVRIGGTLQEHRLLSVDHACPRAHVVAGRDLRVPV